MTQTAANLRANYTPPPGWIPPGLIWLQGAGAPVDGVAGTGHGVAAIGSRYTNTTTGDEYVNTGTQASPTWTGVVIGTVGPGNDVVELSGAGAPTDGVAGTGAGVAGPMSTYHDVTNKTEYRNSNTKASPTWLATVTL